MKKHRNKDVSKISVPRAPHWIRSKRRVTEDEVKKILDMNWEWYYNCYLFLDQPLEIKCKICGGMNIFLPREMKKKCTHCGIECRRCEVDENTKETKKAGPRKR